MAKNVKKPKFPKRVAGIKLPRPVRNTGTGLMRFASTPLGAALVADLIIAGAARVTQDRRFREAAGDAGREAGRFGSNLVSAVTSAATAAAAPILAAAHQAQADDEASQSERAQAKSASAKRTAAAKREPGEESAFQSQ